MQTSSSRKVRFGAGDVIIFAPLLSLFACRSELEPPAPPIALASALPAASATAVAPEQPARTLRVAPPLYGAGTGRIKNNDLTAHQMLLRCAGAVFSSRLEAGETARFGAPAASGCQIEIEGGQGPLTLSTPPWELQVSRGVVSEVERQLIWEIEVRAYGDADSWPETAVRQWAHSATASTEYSSSSWSAAQMTGAPNTPLCGDAATAWAPKNISSPQPEWVSLTYEKSVRALGARLVITQAPGAVREIEAATAEGWESVWRGRDPGESCPGVLVARFNRPVSTNRLRVNLDLSAHTQWFEIDAVELIGSAY